jgi:hypothetical protein
LLSALTKRLADPGSTLTAAEQTGFDTFIGQGGTGAGGWPEALGGDVHGWNQMCRTNWFNGRFLTAEALRRQDVYFDVRARLNMHALMPGIAYGLGLTTDGDFNTTPPVSGAGWRAGSFSVDKSMTLSPGLAFDMIGRPILVAEDFRFDLRQLLALQQTQPRRVVGGGTEFASCVCLAPDPAGATGGSALIRPGPYLLIIEAAEKPDGQAKVYGEVCGGSQPVTCQTEAWCSGFGLSLARFPVEMPDGDDVRSAWDLRGILSAYYFDVCEYSLIKRWDPPFATDHGFCAPSGPGRHDRGAVALAMLYLAESGDAVFVDRWIPRRIIADTPGEDWHRTRFGAPPRAARWARIHQFQCMLAESLAVHRLVTDDKFDNMNLLRRGFRHIPPIGFLPIDRTSAGRQANREPSGRLAGVQLTAAQAGAVSGYVRAALQQGKYYFAGTNVLTYGTVALHDDDILEDLSNVFDKDPIQLEYGQFPDFERVDLGRSLYATASNLGVNLSAIVTVPNLGNTLAAVAAVLTAVPVADYVNRHVEIVKLVVPLQGLVRRHPGLGVVAEDAQDQTADWGARALSENVGARAVGGLQAVGIQMLPRHFVVYVKQRLVLLDVLFQLLELWQAALNHPRLQTWSARVQGDPAAPSGQAAEWSSTAQIRMKSEAGPAAQRALAEAALAHPIVRDLLGRVLPMAIRDLAISNRMAAFAARVNEADAALAQTIRDPAPRRQAALERVADSYSAVWPGYQIVQLIIATLPADQAERLIRSVADGATAAASLGLSPKVSAEDEAIGERPPVFATSAAARLYGQLRAAAAARPVTQILPGIRTEATIGEILALAPAEAAKRLGSDAEYAKFRNEYAAATGKFVDAVTRMTSGAPPELLARLPVVLAVSNGDAAKALATLRAGAGQDQAAKTFLDSADQVVELLGSRAADALYGLASG